MANIETSSRALSAPKAKKSPSPFVSIYKHLNNMGASLRCPLCLYTLRDTPVLLPCIHAFCHECITSHFNCKSKNNQYCPVCKSPATRRSIRPSPHLKDLVKGYKSTLRSFGLVPVVYDETANISMTQIPTTEATSIEMKEHLQVSRAWMKELKNSDYSQDKEMDWVREHQKKVVEVDENAVQKINRVYKTKKDSPKRKLDKDVDAEEKKHHSGKRVKVVGFQLNRKELPKVSPHRNEIAHVNTSATKIYVRHGPHKDFITTTVSSVVTPKNSHSETEKDEKKTRELILSNQSLHNCDISQMDESNCGKETDIEKDDNKKTLQSRCVSTQNTTLLSTPKANYDIKPPPKNEENGAQKKLESSALKPRVPKTYLAGTIVSILPRTWSGSNKPGGVARITHAFPDDNCYHVTYVLGGREKFVSGEFVSELDGQDDYVSPTKGKSRKQEKVSSVLGKRRRKTAVKIKIDGKENATSLAKKKKSKIKKKGSINKVSTINETPKETPQLHLNKAKIFSEEARVNTEEMYAEKITNAMKYGVVNILMSSVNDYVLSLVDVLVMEMKKQGVTVKILKDITSKKKPTLCITSTSFQNPTKSATRTLKTMRCVLSSTPILNSKWLSFSLEKKTLVCPSDDMYIRTLPTKGEVVDADSGLWNYVLHMNLLFSKIQVTVCGAWTSGAKKSDVLTLLREGGAIIHSNMKSIGIDQPIVLLCDDSDNSITPTILKQTEKNLKEHKNMEISVVGGSWLFDCISCGRVLDGKDYPPKGKKAKLLWERIYCK